MPVMYYDNSTEYDSGFVADIPTAFILGVPRLRQLRIKKGNSRKGDVLGVCSGVGLAPAFHRCGSGLN